MNKSSNVQKIVVKEDVCEINLTDIHPFKDHPFKVLDDERMLDTVESIREYGVLVPVIVASDQGPESSGAKAIHGVTYA